MIVILITIRVLGLKVPQGLGADALLKWAPVFMRYVPSFVNVGIDWNHHHQLLHTDSFPLKSITHLDKVVGSQATAPLGL